MISYKIKITLACSILFLSIKTYAATFDYISPAEPVQKEVTGVSEKPEDAAISTVTQKAKLTRNDVVNHYEIAMQRFMQSNVKSAYKDFQMLIKHIVPNDYAYLRIADEMAEIGLFNLSNQAIEKSKDRDISFVQSEDIKRFYFPKSMPEEEDEIYLAEIYSNIMYNAQSKEATAELIKNTDLLAKYDYANYIVALGSLKSGDVKNAQKYIDIAISRNPDNVNYKKLKIEIVIQNDDPKKALKILKDIKCEKFYTVEYINKIDTLEKYTLYKTETNDTMKKYYLGYYYYSKGEYVKAIRTLQSAITSKKKTNRLVYALMAEIYLVQKEYEKAQNFAEKSLQLGGNNKQALTVLGKLNYKNQNYEEALKNFKLAANQNENESLVGLAMTNTALGKNNQAQNIYTKILKDSSTCYQAYYNVALADKEREFEYYKKSVAANLKFIDGWVGLAKYSIEKNNIKSASKYLEIVKYIDENDFRYYYYQGLVYKAKGLLQEAEYNFKKSLAINPNNTSAKKELGIL